VAAVTLQAVKIAAYHKLLLGCHKLVEYVGKLVTEQPRNNAQLSVDADDGDVHCWLSGQVCSQDLELGQFTDVDWPS